MTEQDAQNMRDEFAGWAKVLQEAYRQGYTDGQADERAAMVAWLRAPGTCCDNEVLADDIDHGEHSRKVQP